MLIDCFHNRLMKMYKFHSLFHFQSTMDDHSSLEGFKNTLENVGAMDRLQLLNELHSFSVPVHSDDSIMKLRNLTRRALLEEIVKSDNSSYFHQKMLKVCESLKVNETGFKCCLPGCRASLDRHERYVRHLKHDHPNIVEMKCNFGKTCPRIFHCINRLQEHIKDSHSSRPSLGQR